MFDRGARQGLLIRPRPGERLTSVREQKRSDRDGEVTAATPVFNMSPLFDTP
jgi:hypothetical protein